MHTKEPWEYSDDLVYLGREGGFYLGDAPNPKDNARRIVACVNACAGIPTENLDGVSIFEQQQSFRRDYQEMKQQRDELLAALKYVLEDEPNLIPRATHSCREVVRAAIAKARLT